MGLEGSQLTSPPSPHKFTLKGYLQLCPVRLYLNNKSIKEWGAKEMQPSLGNAIEFFVFRYHYRG